MLTLSQIEGADYAHHISTFWDVPPCLTYGSARVWGNFLSTLTKIERFCLILGRIWINKLAQPVFLYRVSHSKVNKVILLWWRYRFRFLLIFWVQSVHEVGPFISICWIDDLCYLWSKMQTCKEKNFGKKSLNVTTVKLFYNFFSKLLK